MRDRRASALVERQHGHRPTAADDFQPRLLDHWQRRQSYREQLFDIYKRRQNPSQWSRRHELLEIQAIAFNN
jgi:hypothetical protein